MQSETTWARPLLLIEPIFIGRDGGIRTHGPLTPSQVRYQAALHPDLTIFHANSPCSGASTLQGLPGLSGQRWDCITETPKPSACDARTRRCAMRFPSG